MYNIMIVERKTKYSPKNIVEPRFVQEFEDLGSAISCMFKLKDLIDKHYDVYIDKVKVKE